MRGLRAALALTLSATAVLVAPGLSAPAYAEGCDPANPQWIEDRPPAFEFFGIDQTRPLSRGADVVVAVVDSGVSIANPHLADVVHPGVNIVESTVPATMDVAGHGTAIASEIAAQEVDGSGVLGIAERATILPVRVYYTEEPREGEPGRLTPESMAAGILWAAEHGANIINVSASTTVNLPALEQAVAVARERGALVVASAGNRSTTDVDEDVLRYPAAYEGVLGVSAVTDAGVWDPAASFASEFVDVAALGMNVDIAYMDAGNCRVPGDGKPSSSFATGYVSAAAALIASRFPDETADQWAYRLMATAMRPEVGARNDQTGWGIIQPYEALTFLDDGTAPGPPSPVHGEATQIQPARPNPDMSPAVDPLDPAKRLVLWWLLGATAFGGLVMLLARMGRSAPRRP